MTKLNGLKFFGLPALDRVFVYQAQFFDNSDMERKQGQSEYSVKLFLWCGEFDFDWRKPDWWRVIQLIEPAKVLKWATKKQAAGEITDEQFRLYADAVEGAEERARENPGEIVRMGHVSSPPGKSYFAGQFVYFVFEPSTLSGACMVIWDGDYRDLGPFITPKKAVKARAAKGEFRLDPIGVIERHKADRKAQRDRAMFGGAPL